MSRSAAHPESARNVAGQAGCALTPRGRFFFGPLMLFASQFVSVNTYAATTIQFLAPPSQWTATEKRAVFYLKADGGRVSSVQCGLSSLNPERGDPAPRDSFECATPRTLEPGEVAELSLQMVRTTLKRGTYDAVIQVLGTDQTGNVVTQTVASRVAIPAVTVKVGETNGIRVRMIRHWPWSSAETSVSIGLHATSDLAPMQLPEAVATQLYVQDGEDKDIIPDGYLRTCFVNKESGSTSAPFCGSSRLGIGRPVMPGMTAAHATDGNVLDGELLYIEPSVPSNIQKASGILKLHSPEFAADIETPITLLVKDWWPFAAAVVFLGQLLSFWVNNWITVGRQNKLNQLQVAPIESSLLRLLLEWPELEGHRDIVAISMLLDTAAQENKLGEVAAAKKHIDEAKQRLDQIASDRPQAPSSGPPAIVMLQKNRASPGRRLNLVLVNSDLIWPANSVYKWEWSGQRPNLWQIVTSAVRKAVKQSPDEHWGKEYWDKQRWRTLYEGQDLRRISPIFWGPGQYFVRVSVDSEVAPPPPVLPFRLERDQARSFLSQIRSIDFGILMLAVVFAAILAYLTIDKLETFGSVSDYAFAFLGGFGLNATTSGFSAVISRFRGASA